MTNNNRAILCIDDDETVLVTLRSFLRQSLEKGSTVEVAESGEEALEILEELEEEGVELEAVISDYIMPGMKGDEVLEKIHQRLPKTVKIMLTGQSDLAGVTNAINRANLYRFLEKPWQNEDLLLTVQSAIKSYRQGTELEKSNSRLKELNENLEQLVRARTDELERKSGQIRQLLDNSGQGFLSFGADLTVEAEHSLECGKLLGKEPAGQPICSLLYPDQPEKRKDLSEGLGRTLEEPEEFKRELYLSLLPGEFRLENRFLAAEYRMLEPGRMMMILTDITHERALEERVRQEQQRLKFVVSALQDREDFLESVEDFRFFLEEGINELLRSSITVEEQLAEAYRHVHTFKGIFAQLDFIHLPQAIHRAEERLAACRESGGEKTGIVLAELEDNPTLKQAMEQDLEAIRGVLGASFFNRERRFTIDEKQLASLEKLADTLLLSGQFFLHDKRLLEALEEIKLLRLVPFVTMLDAYPKGCLQLAQRLEKEVAPFQVTGDPVRVDPELLLPFSKTLVHVFRNAVDHGIETPDQRYEAGKEERGQITCHLEERGDRLVLTIADDGRGIDREKLRKIAAEKGLFAEEEIAVMPDGALLGLIFSDAFSTASGVSDISGRGIGLSAVKKELEQIGGRVEVKSEAGKGTIFRFTLPRFRKPEPGASPLAKGEELPRILGTWAEEFFRTQVAGSRLTVGAVRTLKGEQPLYRDVTALIGIEAPVGAVCAFTFDRPILETILRAYAPEVAEGEEAEEMLGEAAADFSNIVVGNATGQLGDRKEVVRISTPVVALGSRLSAGNGEPVYALSLAGAAGGMEIFCMFPGTGQRG